MRGLILVLLLVIVGVIVAIVARALRQRPRW